MSYTSFVLDGWPCLPKRGLAPEEHEEIFTALRQLVRHARQAPRQNHAPHTPIRSFNDQHIRDRILWALKQAPRPLEAIEIAQAGICAGHGGRTGPGHFARVYRQLTKLFDAGTVLGVMKTIPDVYGRPRRAPVFWTES